jgi:hypothetical protein
MSDSQKNSWYKFFNGSDSSEKLVKGDFDHQVAGHTSEKLQTCFDKYVMKPRIKPALFKNEIQYYEYMFAHDVSINVKNIFVPRYYGVFNEKIENSFNSFEEVEQSYIVLEDLTLGYEMPNLIDIKMGRHTYEPTATKDKVNRELVKYPFQVEIGFRITGFKVYHTNSNEYIYVDKYFGRSLLPECVDYGLALFFYNGEVFHKHIIDLVIEKLRALLVYMKMQTQFHYFCSSILIVYDSFNQEQSPQDAECGFQDRSTTEGEGGGEGDLSVSPSVTPETHEGHSVGEDLTSLLQVDRQISAINIHKDEEGLETNTANPTTATRTESELDKVRVSMIDFAHTIHPQGDAENTVDEGYIYGVTTLIERLTAIRAVLETKDPTVIAEFTRNMELVYQNNRK